MASKTQRARCFLNYSNYCWFFLQLYFWLLPENKPVGNKLIHMQDLSKALKTKPKKLSLQPRGQYRPNADLNCAPAIHWCFVSHARLCFLGFIWKIFKKPYTFKKYYRYVDWWNDWSYVLANHNLFGLGFKTIFILYNHFCFTSLH